MNMYNTIVFIIKDRKNKTSCNFFALFNIFHTLCESFFKIDNVILILNVFM